MTSTLDRPSPGTATTTLDMEFELGPTEFDRVRQLIHQRAGIHLNDGKQAMVYSRLSRRLRETGHRSFASYLQWLESAGGEAAPEWQQFVNSLTTNLTSFFAKSTTSWPWWKTCGPVPPDRNACGAAPRPPARSLTPWP
jgi:chemotaxis protein methyltransferase CheR